MEPPNKPEHEIHVDPHGEHGRTIYCNCGWKKSHPRDKVLAAAGARHMSKKRGK